MRGQGEGEEAGRMSPQVAGRGSRWWEGGGSAYRYLGDGAGIGSWGGGGDGWGVTTGGRQVGGGEWEGGLQHYGPRGISTFAKPREIGSLVPTQEKRHT